MAETNFNVRIQNKYDSLSAWESSNIVLKAGEIALATVNTAIEENGQYIPTVLMKVGDGSKTFSELPWAAAPAADVYSWAKAPTLAYDALPQTLRDEIDALQLAVGEGGSVADAIKGAIDALDNNDAVVDNQFVTAAVQTDGKVVVSRRALTADDIPALAISKISGLQTALDARVLTETFESFKTTNSAEIAAAKKAGDDAAAALETYKGTNDAAVKANADALAAIKDDANIDSFADVVAALAGKQATGDYATKDEAQGYATAAANGKDAAIQAAQDAADQAQADVDALEELVGTLPAGATATTVVAYIEEKTANIASDATVSALADRVEEAEGAIEAIEADYLKAADKTELSNAIALKADQTALQGEIDRAKGEEQKNAAAIKAIADDYLKAADKTEVEGKITALADGAVAANTAAIGVLNGNAETAGSVDYKVAQAVAAIMENPDETMNSINELVTWVNDHAEDALEMSNQVTANKNAIATLNGGATVAGSVDNKIAAVVADFEEYQTANDAAVQSIQDDVAELQSGMTEHTHSWNDLEDKPFGTVSSKSVLVENATYDHWSSITAHDEWFNNYPAVVVYDGQEYNCEQVYDTSYDADYGVTWHCYGNLALSDCGGPDNGLPFCIIGNEANEVQFRFADENSHTVEVYRGSTTTKVLDSEYIGSDIARVTAVNAVSSSLNTLKNTVNTKASQSDLTALTGRVTTAEGKITTLEGQMTTAQGDIDAVEAKLEGIDTTVAAKIEAAIEALKIGDYAKAADLTAAVERIAQNESDIDALEGRMTTAEGKVTTLEGQMTTAEGNISTLQTEVAKKANDADLAAVAKSGNVNDLIQTTGDVIIFNCGTASTII